ncbi:MAG: DUF935 family protein [Cyclobacteriaceae bacterium]|nr:DUF935 family protein [Cyclobacteriaceae bacterium]
MKSQEIEGTELVVNQINVVSANRTSKDIGTFKTAINSAESVAFPNRVLLYDIYDQILIDGHLCGVTQKRISNTLNKELHFVDNGGHRIKELDSTINSNEFREVIRAILESIFWGVSGLEFIPGEKLKFKVIPRKHIKPESRTIATNQYDSIGTINYEYLSHVWVIGESNNLGLLLMAAPYIIYKNNCYGDWAQYIEIFGQPVRVIYYDAHDKKTKMELREVLDESGSSLALMIPKQAEFKLFDGKESNADGELYSKFIKSCNQDVSVLILGNTETTSSSSKSGLAQAQEHNKQQVEIIKSDLHFVEAMLNSNRFKAILKSYGLPVDQGRFKFCLDIDLESLRERIDIDTKVNNMVPIDPDYFYRTYGIPKPKNFDALMRERNELIREVEDELISQELSLMERVLKFYRNAIESIKPINKRSKDMTEINHIKVQENSEKLLKSMGSPNETKLNMIANDKSGLKIFTEWLSGSRVLNIFK